MPLETRARAAAERLLVLTEAVAEAVLNDRLDELAGLLESRQSAIGQLGTMKIDAPAAAVLERVRESESDLAALIARSQESVSQELVRLFSGNRQVRAYRPQPTARHLQRTG